MSIQALNWAINQPIKNSGAKFVLTILANYSDESGVSYPGQETIADLCAMTDRAVRNHLVWLEEHGYISKHHRRYNNKISTDKYQLEFTKPKIESAPLTRKRKQEENISGSKEEKNSATETEQAEKISARKQAENISKASGKHFQNHPENISGNTKAAKEYTQNTHNGARGRESPARVPEAAPPEEKYGTFRDGLEDWWCKLHGIVTLPPDQNTAVQVKWLFDNKFSLVDVQGFYEFATNDPEEKSWRKGSVTLGAIVKGIAKWKAVNQPSPPEIKKPSLVEQCPDCDSSGLIEITVDSVKRLAKCKHENLKVK